MSRRARAAAFGAAATLCAILAAGITGGYREDVESQLGPLRPVVVARQPLPAKRVLRAGTIERSLALRRVPERFLPAGVLTSPEQAVGRAPATPIPAGSYLTVAALAPPKRERRAPTVGLGSGRHPVEIAVAGASALTATAGAAREVDVVVTTEPGPGGGAGRTYIAARGVRLLDLRPGDEVGEAAALPGGSGSAFTATLGLTRAQALDLIQAESFARQVRLIPR